MKCENADIHFLAGGTQANLTVIAALLRSFEGVICADTGHVNIHEAGAIEATGHRLIPQPTPDGKLTVANIETALARNDSEFTPKPRLVYISNTTERGTVYSKEELTAISAFCRAHGLLLFMDGARLGSAMACKQCGLTLADCAALCDVFYIGGTKNGALIGEAVVILNDACKADFRRAMKQRGAILAKGRVLGVQFEELFRGSLFAELARHENAMADLLREGIRALGYPFAVESPSNQIFPIFPNNVLERMRVNFVDSTDHIPDPEHTCVRLCTSWATKEEAVGAYLRELAAVTKELA